MGVCGIDLGTTNSLIAAFGEDGPRLIPNALGQVLTPSAVGLGDDGAMLVGAAARERLLTHPDKTAASFKRLMGTAQETRFGRLSLRPEELSAFVLRSLKADAEAYLGHAIEEAVISVPAYFNDHQRKATLDAGRLAGLKVERLINEPTAAALAYGFGERAEGKFLVFDLGGGTFDVSILDKYESVMEVRATAGDTHLGGDDFTAAIEHLIARQQSLTPSALKPVDAARLRRAAEIVKIDLTREDSARYDVRIDGRDLSGAVTRDAFEAEASGLVRRLRAPIERAILDALLEPRDLDCVVMVGGATRTPMVRSLAARLFGRLPLIHIDPDTTIALGAAVQAGLKARAAALEDVVMTDVCPFTLGIAVIDDSNVGSPQRVAPIIERNAVAPISRTGSFSTVYDQQKKIALNVYQGENLRPENNVLLGSVTVETPPNKAGAESVEVRFTYDVNGALELEAKVLSTGAVKTRIFRNATGMTDAELSARFSALSAIKLPPREDAENKLLIARAERLYAEHTGESRERIRMLLTDFEKIIADQKNRDVDGARRSFAAILDRLERSPFGKGPGD